jgi:hypothetical protein
MVNNAGNANEGPARRQTIPRILASGSGKIRIEKKRTNTLTTAPISQSNGGNATILV